MNTKFFRVALTVFVLSCFTEAIAQNYAETALLFSRTKPNGSARVQAMGGSQIALGGDYSSALSNPAGLGMFNRSEFTFSTALSSHNTSAIYLDNEENDQRTVFNIPGVSIAIHMPKENGAFLGGTFGVSYSRTIDFNRATLMRGKNDENSIVDHFIDQAYGHTKNAFLEGGSMYNTPTGLSWHNYLIGDKSILNPPGPNDEYFTDATYPDVQQEETLVKGASGQWSFSYGANIKDRFFIGAGFGVTSIRYKAQQIFSETFVSDKLEYLQLDENLDIRGTGINATIGAIARPVDFIQIGVSVVTPTAYSMTETYDAAMGTRWNNFDYWGDGSEILGDNTQDPEKPQTDLLKSDYNLTTPFKFSSGVAFISKFGLLTGDIEMTNPAKARYNSDTPGISFSNENDDIQEIYQQVINWRVGAEYRYDIFRFRAGYGVQGNTYDESMNADNKISSISGGAGFRTEGFYLDFALVHSTSNRYAYQPYTFFDGSGPVAGLKNNTTTGMLTFGFTF